MAVVRRPATSDPAKASVMARHIYFLPLSTSSIIALRRCASGMKFMMQGSPMTMPASCPSWNPRALDRTPSCDMIRSWK